VNWIWGNVQQFNIKEIIERLSALSEKKEDRTVFERVNNL
jgi:hypothetical protein